MKLWERYRADVLIAVVGAGAAVPFLVGEGTGLLLTVPLVFLVLLARRRLPLLAALGVLGVMALHTAMGLPSESPGVLAAWLLVAYALGRYGSALAGGGALVVFMAIAFTVSEPDYRVGNAIFAVILSAVPWGLGRLVRRRADDAGRAATEVSVLAEVDPAAGAAQVVAEERAWLAGEVVRVVRAGVQAMQRHAGDAEADLDPTAMEAVQEEGRRAVAELRRLLGLLRSEEPPPPAPEPAQVRLWPVDLLIAAGIAGLFLVEFFLIEELPLPSAAVGLGLAASVALRRVDAMVACLVALLAVALAETLRIGVPYTVTLSAVFALLAWSVAVRGRWRAYAALGAFMLVVVIDVYRIEPGNVPITIAAFAIAAVAGHLWAAGDRQERSAAADAAALRAEHEAVAARAVRAERLRLARELHDVTSHAVGVMVLQAGAAAAQRTQGPQRAHAAMRTVRETASDALRELDALAGLLDVGAVGPIGPSGPRPERNLAAALQELAGRVRTAGLQVSMTLPDRLPEDEIAAATVYRVVQESLTNATRYAPDSRVEIEIRTTGESLQVDIRDDGMHPTASAEGGFGLVGLAERVRALGGDFAAGPRPGGGFAVAATLPISQPAQVSP
jgi:signal transduction histidine kinase